MKFARPVDPMLRNLLITVCLLLGFGCADRVQKFWYLIAHKRTGIDLEIELNDSVFTYADVAVYDSLPSTRPPGVGDYLSRLSTLRGPRIRLVLRNTTVLDLHVPHISAEQIGLQATASFPNLGVRLSYEGTDLAIPPNLILPVKAPCEDVEFDIIPAGESFVYPVMIDVFLVLGAGRRPIDLIHEGDYEVHMSMYNPCWKDIDGMARVWIGEVESNHLRFRISKD